tara:strand:+ start:11138 stop:11734 length:597 start_codon:yes stop_codon:yes gene_type:complete
MKEEKMKGFLKGEGDINPLENKHRRKRLQVFGPKKKEYDYKPPEGMQVTPCQCQTEEGSIFCNPHKCRKSASLQRLCKTRMDYFEMWERGEGPMQSVTQRVLAQEAQKAVELDKNSSPPEEEKIGFFMGDIDIPLESRGLGDTFAKITKATGVKKVVDTVFNAINKDCGCTERQSKLNKMFPYKKEETKKRKTKGFFD